MNTAGWDIERPCSWIPAFAGMTTGHRPVKLGFLFSMNAATPSR